MSKQTVVIATNNKHKLEEIRYLLKNFPLDIRSMKEVGLEGIEITEDGSTFEENAIIKAKTVMNMTGFSAIADDSGLEVDAIGNSPGIYSARFAGETATDDENNLKLLKLMEGISEQERTARFVCAIAMVFKDGEIYICRGTCEGKIGFEPKGKEGFGYDPLFIVPEYNMTFAQIDAEMKSKISHRARALEKLKHYLMENYQEG